MTFGRGAHLDPGPAVCFPVRPMEPGATDGRAEPPPEPPSVVSTVQAPEPRGDRRGSISGSVDRWWGCRRMAELDQRAREIRSAGELCMRARRAAELGERAVSLAGASLSGGSHELACELFRESIYWSISALRMERGSAQPTSAATNLASVWADVEAEYLPALAPEPHLLAAARADFVDKTPADFAESSPDECAESARRLGSVARALLDVGGSTRRELEGIWFRRTLGFALCALVVSVALIGWGTIERRLDETRDLASGRTWKASSDYGGVGCRSPAQSGEECRDYFFHTLEEERPWLELDLGAPQLVSEVRVVNRKDCCQERATPLAVEVATTQGRFAEVARFVEPIVDERLEFTPVRARYVRLRPTRRTLLHLARVRVYGP